MMRSLSSIIGCVLVALWAVGCSESDSTAGIEIGNPEIAQNIGLTADFSIDYSDAKPVSLAKAAAKNEKVVIDTFQLTLTEVRSFCSFYVGVSVNQEDGLLLWPYEDDPAAVLPISFTDGEFVKDAFYNIDLKNDGFLKEIGVGFEVGKKKSVNSIYGRIRQNGKEIPFVYELNNFQVFKLLYNQSQIEVQDSAANLSVIFRVHRFVDGLDLASAKVGENGVIRFSKTENKDLWNSLNERFLPSFQAMRYSYTAADGKDYDGFVDDVWTAIAGQKNKNLISNGNFSEGGKNWIFHKQFNGAADTAIVKEKNSNVMKVHVTKGGNFSYSVQLLHENIPVIVGYTYKFVFTIWSDVEGEMTARLGNSIYNGETNGFQEHVKVSTSGKSFEIEFSPAETDPYARLDLNLGSRERTFWIKDVQLIRIK
ncbi:carbohydrate binding domain-containing protein [uncultured Fibrobacter sp.]|uniref:carbohydrate binding domain-containing protein n=1 Tax=uncultured Fibrobacter sp. TaxID=261512 RepID=UPI0025F5600E|nr:carbohydrate binding domain-containing protein [uncultured Fibrobacter sp.]